ncbi:hypothetical protein ACWGJP_01925 [Microbacterium sp. NPDC055903]
MTGWELGGFTVLFVLLTLLSAHRYRSWLAPAPLWNLAWSALFFSTSTLGYGFDYSAGSVSVLATLAALFNVPGFVLNSKIPDDTDRAQVRNYAPPTWLLVLMLAAGLVGIGQLSVSLGMSIFSIRSLDQLFLFGQQNAASIFRGEVSLGWMSNLTFALLQCGAALAGCKIAWRPNRAAYFVTAGLIGTALLWSSVTTQRSYLLVPVIWFVAGYVAALVALGARRPPLRAVAAAAALGIILLILVVFLRSVRTSGADAGLSEASFAPTRLWLAGYIPTFSAWFDQAVATSLSAGVFGGIVALIQPIFGIRATDDGQGVFYPIGSGLTSNTGTAMMTIVGSGGFVWGMLIIVALGAIAHLAYVGAAKGNAVAVAGYIGVLAGTLWVTNAWFFGYGGRVLALVLLLTFAAMARREAFRQTGTRPPSDLERIPISRARKEQEKARARGSRSRAPAPQRPAH